MKLGAFLWKTYLESSTKRAPVESPAARVIRLGTIVGLANHTILLGKDGAEIHIDDSGAPIRDDSGHLAGIVLVFRDITDRWQKDRQLRAYAEGQRFLLSLSDQLRHLTNDRAIMQKAAELVGRQLKVGRAGYGEVSDNGEIIRFETGWAESDLGMLIGPLPFKSFGSGNVSDLKSGLTTVYDDILADPRLSDRAREGIGAASAVGVPIIRGGALHAVFTCMTGKSGIGLLKRSFS